MNSICPTFTTISDVAAVTAAPFHLYSHMHIGDGNCFYRALAFRYFQYIRKDAKRLEKARLVAQGHKDLLFQAGFEEFAFVDFYDEYMSVLNQLHSTEGLLGLLNLDEAQQVAVMENAPEDHDLWLVLSDLMLSNAVVVHLRFITSAHLKANADMYLPFMDDGYTMEMFCNQFVEAMDRYD